MGKPSYTAIAVERRGDADWVTLNRPERLNALDQAMVDDLLEYFGSAGADPACRGIVLRGAGPALRAGADIQEAAIGHNEDAAAWPMRQRRLRHINPRMPPCPQPAVPLLD